MEEQEKIMVLDEFGNEREAKILNVVEINNQEYLVYAVSQNDEEDGIFAQKLIKDQYGKAEIITKGKNITIVAIGKMVNKALEVKEMLAKDNIKATVINARFLKPLDIKHSIYPINAYFIEKDVLHYRDENYYYAVKTLDQINSVEELPDDYIVFKNRKDLDKVYRMIQIVNTALNVIDLQLENKDEISYLAERTELNREYDEFVRIYGAIHKRTNIGLLEDDPNLYVLESLEEYNPKTKTIKKADIFFERTINPRIEIKHVDNLQDAIRLSLDTYGKLELDYMSSIYSKNSETVQEELISNGFAFIEPTSNELVIADEYLSGDIYEKIEIAKENYKYHCK